MKNSEIPISNGTETYYTNREEMMWQSFVFTTKPAKSAKWDAFLRHLCFFNSRSCPELLAKKCFVKTKCVDFLKKDAVK